MVNIFWKLDKNYTVKNFQMNNQCLLRILTKDVRHLSGSSSSVSVYFLWIPEFHVNVYGNFVYLHLQQFYLIKPHTQAQKSIRFTSSI